MFDDSSLEQFRAAQRGARQLQTASGLWLVYELRAALFDERRGTSLVFESDSVIRRVRKFPPNWRELTDEELLALSWSD